MATDPENAGQAELELQPPTNFVSIRPERSGCGRYAFGSWDILVNVHTTRRIRMSVRTEWNYHSTTLQSSEDYTLGPREEINLGCDFWRPDLEPLQEFERTITRAIYV